MEQLDVVTKPTVAHECLKVSYIINSVPATRFGQSCGHLQEGALQRMPIYIYILQKFVNQCTYAKY